jgi:hypothetical protein
VRRSTPKPINALPPPGRPLAVRTAKHPKKKRRPEIRDGASQFFSLN